MVSVCSCYYRFTHPVLHLNFVFTLPFLQPSSEVNALFVGRSSPVVERQNQDSLGSNTSYCCFETCAFSFSSRRPRSFGCITEYLAINTGENMIDWYWRSNCSMAECFPEKWSWVRMNRYGRRCPTDWVFRYIEHTFTFTLTNIFLNEFIGHLLINAIGNQTCYFAVISLSQSLPLAPPNPSCSHLVSLKT